MYVEQAAHISSSAAYSNCKGQYLKLYLTDTSNERTRAILTLYDEKMVMSAMLNQSDFIGLYHPGICKSTTPSQATNDGCVKLEYTNDTVIFCMTEQDAISAGLNTLMKRPDPSVSRVVSPNVSTQTDNSITSQWSEISSDGKVRIYGIAYLSNNQSLKARLQDTIDCKMRKDRIYIKDLKPRMTNVTLLGRICKQANNVPT